MQASSSSAVSSSPDFAKPLRHWLRAFVRPAEQELAGKPARDVQQHGPHRQPSQPGIEMNAAVDEDQKGASPRHSLVKPQQLDRLPDPHDVALAQRISERKDD